MSVNSQEEQQQQQSSDGRLLDPSTKAQSRAPRRVIFYVEAVNDIKKIGLEFCTKMRTNEL